MTVSQLLSSMSSQEMTEWMYFFTIKAQEQAANNPSGPNSDAAMGDFGA